MNDMGLIIFFIVAVAVMCGIFALSYVLGSNMKKKLKDYAVKMGLQFHDGAGLSEVRPDITASPEIKALTGETMSILLGMSNRWMMEGIYNNLRVAVYLDRRGTGKTSNTYTVFRVDLPAPLNAGLSIAKEGLFEKMGKAFGGQDIQTGNAELDRKVIIRATDANRARQALMDPSVQKTLIGLFKDLPETRIDDYSITYDYWGYATREEIFRDVLNRLTRDAASLRFS